MSKELAEKLAAKVVSSVAKSGVREEILAGLLRAVEVNVHESTLEALLIAIGHANMERDREWVNQLKGEWSPKSSLRTATTPAEVEQEIRTWHAAGLAEIRATAFKAGYDAAWPEALERGTRFGFGATAAGYSGLEEVLKAASKTIKAV